MTGAEHASVESVGSSSSKPRLPRDTRDSFQNASTWGGLFLCRERPSQSVPGTGMHIHKLQLAGILFQQAFANRAAALLHWWSCAHVSFQGSMQ